MDDVRSSHFFSFIEKGLLPNLKRLLENGIYSKNCVTDFPSVTYPTHPTILTGTYPGAFRNEPSHGITGYHWMDRATAPPEIRHYGTVGTDELIQIYKINSDLGPNCQTMLEMIGEGNLPSIFQLISRGANHLFPKSKISLAMYYMLLTARFLGKKSVVKLLNYINNLVVRELLDTFKKPRKYFEINEAPIGSNLWFMTPDIIMHAFGYDSHLYKINLLLIDRAIGMLVNELEAMGYLDDTAIAITSDHGNYRVGEIGNILSFYTSSGLKNYHPRKNYRGIVNITEFASVGHFHFKGSRNSDNRKSWPRPTLKELKNFGPKKKDMLEELLRLKGIELMYYREDGNTTEKGTIHLKRKDLKNSTVFSSIIEYKGKGSDYKTRYTSENDESDVFGFYNDNIAVKMMDGKFHKIDEWLDSTHHLDHSLYPDLIPRYFKNSRSADVVVSTLGNVIYKVVHGKIENSNRYDHDIGLRKSSVVPLIVSGSEEIPIKLVPFCKTTDIVPSLVHMLGKRCHDSVVGNNLC
ncbi:MAG: alkaline phosphatase family protein [Promethearchaeota archaeon]